MILVLSALAHAQEGGVKFEGEVRTLELDQGGGTGGAPEGMTYISPPGSGAELFTGDLGEGVRGLRLSVPNESNALVCTAPIRLGGQVMVKTRLRVSGLSAGASSWMGMNWELRARDAAGGLVSPAGGMYVLIANLRESGGWQDLQQKVAVPPGAVSGEVCYRFVHSTGVLDVDRLQLVAPTPGASAVVAAPPPAPAPAPVPALPMPISPTPPVTPVVSAPPPAAETYTTVVAPAPTVGGGTFAPGTWSVTAEQVGNSVACTEWIPSSAPLKVKGSLRIAQLDAGAPDWSGITLEGYAQDASGRALGKVGQHYTPIWAVTDLTDGPEFSARFVPPPRSARVRLCARFSSAAGSASLDWSGK